jgi:hypothetical protein
MISKILKLVSKAGWAPFSVLLFHNGVARLFGHNPALDPAMHFLGGIAIAYFFYTAIEVGIAWFGITKPFPMACVAFCMATTVAVFWEFIEFAGGLFVEQKSQTSLDETMYDLLLGCGGAMVCIILLTLFRLFKKS